MNIITQNGSKGECEHNPLPSNRGVIAPLQIPENLLYEGQIVIGAIACDYITLSTFDGNVAEWIRNTFGMGDRMSIRGYSGYRGKHWFWGIGSQFHKEYGMSKHLLLRVSGGAANIFTDYILSHSCLYWYASQMTCTRFDIQYTHENPLYLNLSKVTHRLRSTAWNDRRGLPRPSIDLRDSDDGLSTMYIGKRSSARFHRVYIKPVNDSNLTRWEIEYKGKLSRKIWQDVQDYGFKKARQYFLGDVYSVPKIHELKPIYESIQGESEKLRLYRDTSDVRKRITWLDNTVLPTVKKVVNDLLEVGDNELKRRFGNWIIDVVNEYNKLVES